jgi:hypothetical protein
LAQAFEITTRTIWRWRSTYKEFCQALMAGKGPADDRVECSLYQRAVVDKPPIIAAEEFAFMLLQSTRGVEATALSGGWIDKPQQYQQSSGRSSDSWKAGRCASDAA